MKKYCAAICAIAFAVLAIVFMLRGNAEAMSGFITSCALSVIWSLNEKFIECHEEYISNLRKKIREVAG